MQFLVTVNWLHIKEGVWFLMAQLIGYTSERQFSFLMAQLIGYTSERECSF